MTINRTTSANYHLEVVEANQGAIQTDGSNDFAVVIGDDSIGDGLPVSAALELRAHDKADFADFLHVGTTVPNWRLETTNVSGEVAFVYDTASTDAYFGNGVSSFTMGDRVVLAGTAAGSDQELYADGVSVATQAAGISAQSGMGPLTVGPHAATFFRAGVLAERLSDTFADEIATEWAAS